VSSINLEMADAVTAATAAAVYEAIRAAVGPDVEINLGGRVYAPKDTPAPAPAAS
jgi:hypothetical protein